MEKYSNYTVKRSSSPPASSNRRVVGRDELVGVVLERGGRAVVVRLLDIRGRVLLTILCMEVVESAATITKK